MIKGEPKLGFGRTDLKEEDEKRSVLLYKQKEKEGRRMRKKGEKYT